MAHLRTRRTRTTPATTVLCTSSVTKTTAVQSPSCRYGSCPLRLFHTRGEQAFPRHRHLPALLRLARISGVALAPPSVPSHQFAYDFCCRHSRGSGNPGILAVSLDACFRGHDVNRRQRRSGRQARIVLSGRPSNSLTPAYLTFEPNRGCQ